MRIGLYNVFPPFFLFIIPVVLVYQITSSFLWDKISFASLHSRFISVSPHPHPLLIVQPSCLPRANLISFTSAYIYTGHYPNPTTPSSHQGRLSLLYPTYILFTYYSHLSPHITTLIYNSKLSSRIGPFQRPSRSDFLSLSPPPTSSW